MTSSGKDWKIIFFFLLKSFKNPLITKINSSHSINLVFSVLKLRIHLVTHNENNLLNFILD